LRRGQGDEKPGEPASHARFSQLRAAPGKAAAAR
jgi:hypothetical protein